MVLWEITLGTAYFLGLRRTYGLALKIQRRLISPKHPKIRQFVQRVHRSIQERDLEVGRNLGSWILRWLDRMKPSAQIRGSLPGKPHTDANSSISMTKHMTNSLNLKPGNAQSTRESDKHFFTSSGNIWPKRFPTIAMMMRPPKPAGTTTHYRHFYNSSPEAFRSNYRRNLYEGVFRNDIMQWMMRN
ncbi:envelope glycoprotein [Quillaja saponaria]|uniref:Envelope glycoprotein n=1 Tax=Quillaja saponaria TaxID=32244 RepID=A0AAD7KQJ7_QUISA|nr:envelope glycoprotein [Quillaja saponaria]